MKAICQRDVEQRAVEKWRVASARVVVARDFYFKAVWQVLGVQQNVGDVYEVVGRRASLAELLQLVESRNTPFVQLPRRSTAPPSLN